MKGKGLMLVLGGKPKGKLPMDEDESASEESGGTEDTLAGEAFDALQDGDRAGFAAAFKAAVKACVGKAGAGGYEDEEDDAEGF